jgi:hypothetical protein
MSEEIKEWLMTYGGAVLSAFVVIGILFLYFSSFAQFPIAQSDACVNFCKEKNMSFANLNTTNEKEYICYCKYEIIIPIGKINKDGKIENYTQ